MTMKSMIVVASVLLLFAGTARTHAQNTNEPRKLSKGNSGIAAQHPGDVGIDRHKSVVFVENFNDDLKSVKARWDSVKAEKDLSLANDVPIGSAGKYSLLVTHLGGRGVGSHLYRRLRPGYKKLHYRYQW